MRISVAHIILFFALAMAASCNRKPETVRTFSTDGISVVLPMADIVVSNERLVFTNKTTGEQVEVARGAEVTMLVGLYDCFYMAKATVGGNETSVYASANSIVISDKLDFSLNAYMVLAPTDFIIEEIFFSGTLQPSEASYNGDNYVKLYNPTDHVLYADGIALCESSFNSNEKTDYRPDIRTEAMTVQAIYVVPGGGTEHPVEPGQSFVLCDIGIDHRVSNTNSFDLSGADMEWYDTSSSASNVDIDSETVPNLDRWYCYTASFWMLHRRGLKSYAIARIPIGKSEYLKNYKYDYEYVIHVAAGNFYMDGSGYKLPNEWILDGVNCTIASDFQWCVLPPQIDAGWTYAGRIPDDPDRYFKSVRRKMLGFDIRGNRILMDTNNSTSDFNPMCVPSIIESQHTSIDVSGTKATVETYDGVWVVEKSDFKTE